MSPEQVAGSEHVDLRSDIYSLACTLYELLVGEPPFAGENPQEILVRQLSAEALPLRQHLPSASAELEACLARALAKDPAGRFATAKEFAQALDSPIASVRMRQGLRQHRHRLWAWIAVLVAGVIAIAGYALASRSPLHERDWLVVADFDGPSSDPGLASAFRELVTAELNRGQFVRILPRQQLNATLRDAGLAETTTVNADLARELAFRSAVRGVVSGTIKSVAGNRYALSIRVSDADHGSEILSLDDVAAADNLMPAIATLAGELRSRLGERRGDIAADRPLLDIATPSLPAYRAYVQAIALKQLGDISGSNHALKHALVYDTAFASAWALLGLNYVEQRDLDSARVAFAQALRRPRRLSDASRYRLSADAAYAIDYDLNEAVRWYAIYFREFPHSIGGRNNYGLYLSFLGRREEALDAFARAANESPLGPGSVQSMLLNETAELITLGRVDRARAVARELTGPFAAYAQLQFDNVSGNLAAAESLAMTPANSGASVGWLRVEALTTLAAVSAAYGKLTEADRRLGDATASATGAERRWYENLRELLALVAHSSFAFRTSRISSDTVPGELVTRGLAAFATTDTVALKRELLLLRARPQVDSARLGQSIPVLQALLDDSRGRWEEVIARLTPFARRGEDDAINLDRLPAVWSRWLLAMAFEHEGRPDSAITYLHLAIADTGIASGHLVVRTLVAPFAHRELARQYEVLAEHDSATAEWRRLVLPMKNPDRAGAQLASEARRALAPRR